MRSIVYPNDVTDIVAVEFRGAGRVGFLVRPKTAGRFRLLLWPQSAPDPALVLERLIDLPSADGPPVHVVFDLARHPAREMTRWQWAIVPTESRDRWLADFAAAVGGQPLLAGMFLFEPPALVSEARTVVWSCHEPYDTGPLGEAVLYETTIPTLQWFASSVRGFDPHVVWGGGDAAYSDGTKATNFSDQVYDQGDWYRSPELVRWLRDEYRNMYRHFWSLPEFAAVLRTVPHLFMWDDHEIHDGWGSEGKDFVPGNVAMFEIARQVAHEYTLNAGPRISRGYAEAHQAYVLGTAAAFIFDTRTVRNYEAQDERLVSRQQFDDFHEFLDRVSRRSDITDIITCTTVPFVNLRTWVEEFASNAPDLLNDALLQGIRDDVRDGWASPRNMSTLQAVLEEIGAAMRRRSDVRFWNVSGDIHVANAFAIVLPGAVRPLMQVTTSAISNRALPPAAVRALTEIGDELYLDGIGEVYRVWKTVPDPNALFIRIGGGQAQFTLRALAADGSGEYSMTLTG
jgi:PhoD-like phosphatase